VQVEHCVTEMTTGIDIVKEGIRAAAGEPLSVAQEDVVMRGHAIECRINAEDASKKFAPAPGRIGAYVEPSGPGVRVDSGVRAGSEISTMYDPMVAKLIVWDADREQATQRMLRALGEFEIEGLKTLIPFHRALLQTEQWARGETCRDLLEDREWLKALAFPPRAPKPAGGGEGDDEATAETVQQTYTVEVSGRRFDVKVIGPPPAAGAPARNSTASAAKPPKRATRQNGSRRDPGSTDTLPSPMQGNIWKVQVKRGQQVAEGDVVTIIEAMKMENEITAHKAGVISELPIREGDSIASGETLAVIVDPT
jgi:acetyl-CoA/propionyl-CoA carboxylase biotin carboxyl carrier protein